MVLQAATTTGSRNTWKRHTNQDTPVAAKITIKLRQMLQRHFAAALYLRIVRVIHGLGLLGPEPNARYLHDFALFSRYFQSFKSVQGVVVVSQ